MRFSPWWKGDGKRLDELVGLIRWLFKSRNPLFEQGDFRTKLGIGRRLVCHWFLLGDYSARCQYPFHTRLTGNHPIQQEITMYAVCPKCGATVQLEIVDSGSYTFTFPFLKCQVLNEKAQLEGEAKITGECEYLSPVALEEFRRIRR
jgi:hypothetical protein